MYGSDQSASIENVKDLVRGIRILEKMVGDGTKVVYSYIHRLVLRAVSQWEKGTALRGFFSEIIPYVVHEESEIFTRRPPYPPHCRQTLQANIGCTHTTRYQRDIYRIIFIPYMYPIQYKRRRV